MSHLFYQPSIASYSFRPIYWVLILLHCLVSPALSDPVKPPNIIVIFTDDHGWADLGAHKAVKDIKTPHTDKLAAAGALCRAGYATAPQCQPSRAGIITGRHQNSFGLAWNGLGKLPKSETTLSERLQQKGYVTGMTGKWHLQLGAASNREKFDGSGEFWSPAEYEKMNLHFRSLKGSESPANANPHVHGFAEYSCGPMTSVTASHHANGRPLKNPPRHFTYPKGTYRIDLQTQWATSFINRHANKQKPFFLYLPYYAPHVPLEAPEKYLKRFPGKMEERRRYGLAMLSAIDDGVGKITASLKRNGIEQNTLVFYIGDNGAALKCLLPKTLPLTDKKPGWNGSLNSPWLGEKGLLLEGGIRVPFIVQWKGVIPSGTICDIPVSTLDVAATAMALNGVDPSKEKKLEGINLVPLLKGEKKHAKARSLYWRWWQQAALRKGKWKYLVMGEEEFLFDLESDAHEYKNLIDQFKGRAKAMNAELRQWVSGCFYPQAMPGKLSPIEHKRFQYYMGLPQVKTEAKVPISTSPNITQGTAPKKAASKVTSQLKKDGKLLVISADGMSVGLDLDAGGAIGYLTHKHFPKNMVNIHDKGRYIQQSYYAGQNAERKADGQHKVWSPWCWNPIQGGDSYLNKSQMVKSEVNTTTGEAYIKCLPMQWDMKNKQADATMEQWVSIMKGGDVIKVKNKFTVHSIDPLYAPFDRLRHQEFPALYFIGHFNRYKSYTGQTPWNNDALETRPPYYLHQTGKGWDKTTASECWGAFVNHEDFGVAVYSPVIDNYPTGKHNMLSGLAGKRSTSNEMNDRDSYTSYIAPIGSVKLGPKSVIEYEYYIVVGKIQTIRKKIYELRKDDKK